MSEPENATQIWVLVDDNPDDRALARRELERAFPGIQVRDVHDSAGLDAVWAAGDFTGIITDVHLRWTNGLDVLRESRRRFPDRPVIMFTGTGSEELAVQAMHDGLHDYVLKAPGQYMKLPQSVRRAMATCRLRAERRDAEEALRQSEERLSLALHACDLSLWDWNVPTRTAVIDDTFRRFTGLGGSGPISLDAWTDLIHPDDRDAAVTHARQQLDATNGRVDHEYRMKAADGHWHWVRVTGRTVQRDAAGAPIRVAGVLQDVSDMRNHAVRSERIFELSADLIAVFAASGDMEQVNPAFTQILGWEPAEIIGMNWRELCHPDDLAVSQTVEGQILSGDRLTDFENRIRTRGGAYRWISWSANIDPSSGRMYAVGKDVTDQHARMAQMQSLATVIEHIGEAILVTDARGVITFVNPAFERVTGYSRDEVVGDRPNLLKSGLHSREFYSELWRTISKGQVWKGRFINRRRNGDVYTDESTISPVFDGRGEITNYVEVQRDITDELRMQEHLQQSQKLESVGRLAGGVAHDFNNLLTVINGQAQLMLLNEPDGSPITRGLNDILDASGRAVALTRQLLAFSRQQPLELKRLALGPLISSFSPILQRMIGEEVELQTHLPGDLWTIRADAMQIEQIIMNLAINARDAMHDGGRLLIEAANIAVDDIMARQQRGLNQGPYVRISVSDNGSGMTPEVMKKVFEPFFTTKGQNKGTGLGLSTVYGIVHQHGGTVTVYSEPGVGSTFHVYLPRYGDAAEPQIAAATDRDARQGDEIILVVEDDPAIRKLTQQVLARFGYRGQYAENAAVALKLAKDMPRIDLLLSDVIMPRVGGRELYDQLCVDHPDLRVLFMSGYAADAMTAQREITNIHAFIQKPFTIDNLLNRIRAVLDADGSETL